MNMEHGILSKKPDNLKGVSFFIFLILIETFWLLGSKISEMLLDLMQLDGLTFEEIQYAEQFFHYSVAATVLLWGLFVDRKPQHRKIILIASNLIWVCGSILLYFIPITQNSYFIIQILWGLSFGANGPIIGSYLGDLFRINNRGKLFSTFTIFVYIIKASAIGVNGILGNALNNWKLPTFLFAIGSIILLIIFAFRGKDMKLASVEPELLEKIESGYEYNKKITWKGFISVIKKPTNIFFLLQGVTGMMGVVIVTRYMNYWFTSNIGMDMDEFIASIILGAGAAIGALFGITLVGKWIDRKFNQNQLNKSLFFAITCLFVQVIFYFILTMILEYPDTINPLYNNFNDIFTYYPVFYGFIIVFNLCSFCGTPVGTTVNVARTFVNAPEHRGTAAALYDLFDFIGSGIALIIGSIIFNLTGDYQSTIFIGSLFWIISAVLWLFILRFIKRDYLKVREYLNNHVNQMN